MKHPLKIACAVPRVAVADPDTNRERICSFIEKAAREACDLLVFPKMALTGCTCGDLFHQRLLQKSAERALGEITEFAKAYPHLSIVLGLPRWEDGAVQSAAAVIRGEGVPETCVPDDGAALPVTVGDTRVLVQIAGEPELAGGRDTRRRKALARSKGGIYVYCSAGWDESVSDGVYCGHSMIVKDGTILAENSRLADGDYLLTASADAPALPFAPKQPEKREKQPFYTGFEEDILSIQAAGLARRLQLLRAKAVVGVSGGLDSTLALLAAVEAMDRLGRPVADVHALTMPGFGTTGRTYENARTLMDLLGVTVKEIPIGPAVLGHFRDIGHDPQIHDLTYENAQARERTQILMDYAGKIGGIVVGTGDLSELALGWCTYNGDHMSMYGVNASLPKTLIPEVIRRAGEKSRYAPAKAVLEDIIATPISPELLPPDAAGAISQQTEDLVGPYVLHDFFLYHTLKNGTTPKDIYALACRVFREDYSPAVIKKWLGVFYRRFFTQQFKRNCMPEGVKVLNVSLSPRGDWAMPGDAGAGLWLRETEELA